MLAAAVPAAAPAEPLTLPSVAPPELVALTQKMEALQVTSERISLQAAIVPHGGGKEERELLRFLSLFDVSVAGEEGGSPPVASLVVGFFGAHLRVRVVGGSWYVYLGHALARRDGGRPWIDLGSAGLGALLTVNGKHPRRTKPAPTPQPESFAALARLLRSPEAVTPLGAGTVDGQAVQGFRETVAASLLESEPIGKPGAIVSRSTPPPPPPPPPPAARKPSPPATATVEAFIAPDGQPVHVRVDIGEEDVDVVVKLDVFAINFPLTVVAPPARQTLGLAAFRRLEHAFAGRHRRRG